MARIATFFGLLALLLACVGLYGVLSYAVARRTNEIGIRIALGAMRRDVIWLVLREALALVGAGVVIGLLASLAATKTVSTLLYGLRPNDPLTIAAATTGSGDICHEAEGDTSIAACTEVISSGTVAGGGACQGLHEPRSRPAERTALRRGRQGL